MEPAVAEGVGRQRADGETVDDRRVLGLGLEADDAHHEGPPALLVGHHLIGDHHPAPAFDGSDRLQRRHRMHAVERRILIRRQQVSVLVLVGVAVHRSLRERGPHGREEGGRHHNQNQKTWDSHGVTPFGSGRINPSG